MLPTGSGPTSSRPSTWVICGLAAVALIGVVVAAIGALGPNGYQPERYADGIDPVLAGLAWFSAWGTVFLVALAVVPLRAWITTHDRRALEQALGPIGMAMSALAMLGIVIVNPGRGTHPLDGALVALLIGGIGIMFAGGVPELVRGIREAIRTQGWVGVAIILAFVALFLLGALVRRL
jgi:hypothetical protein